MTLMQHTKLTGAAALLLLPFWDAMQIFWFAVGSILIDIDHYIFYVMRCRRFDIRGMFRYFNDLQEIQKSIPYAGLCIFHTLDFFVLVGLLAFYHPAFLYLLAGLLFHFAVDLVHLYRCRFIFGRAFFIIEHIIRKRRYAADYPFC